MNLLSVNPRGLTLLTVAALVITIGSCGVKEKTAKPEDATKVPEGFALIPAGSFQMGDTLDGEENAPVHDVTLSAFYMAKNLVTWAQWSDVRSWATAHGYRDFAPGAGKASNHPVQTVMWLDCVKYCNARSEKEGLTPCYTVSGSVMRTGTTVPTVNWTADGYRLPTEAEWEKSARGGLSCKRFPWGDTISHTNANFWNDGDESYQPYQTGTSGYDPKYGNGGKPYTSPVGSFAANGYGLYDIVGNVSEWCWDWYDTDVPYSARSANDPHGAASGSYRVCRGGNWDYRALNCRVGFRDGYFPDYGKDYIGFRLARSLVRYEPRTWVTL